jgi:hypothetical protein
MAEIDKKRGEWGQDRNLKVVVNLINLLISLTAKLEYGLYGVNGYSRSYDH